MARAVPLFPADARFTDTESGITNVARTVTWLTRLNIIDHHARLSTRARKHAKGRRAPIGFATYVMARRYALAISDQPLGVFPPTNQRCL